MTVSPMVPFGVESPSVKGIVVTFREKLNELRLAKGWSVRKLAKEAGLPFGSVAAYLTKGNSQRLPTFGSAVALSRALGVPTSVFEGCSDWAKAAEEGTSGE